MFPSTPLIKLGENHFKKVAPFLSRFSKHIWHRNWPNYHRFACHHHCSYQLLSYMKILIRFGSIPDVLELDHLTVSGDVTFGRGGRCHHYQSNLSFHSLMPKCNNNLFNVHVHPFKVSSCFWSSSLHSHFTLSSLTLHIPTQWACEELWSSLQTTGTGSTFRRGRSLRTRLFPETSGSLITSLFSTPWKGLPTSGSFGCNL